MSTQLMQIKQKFCIHFSHFAYLTYLQKKLKKKKKKKGSHIQEEKQIHDDNSTFPTWLKIDLQ